MSFRILLGSGVLALALIGCGDDDTDPPRDSGLRDGGRIDAPMPPEDSGPDAFVPFDGPFDTGVPPIDGGPCDSTDDCPAPASECETAFCGGMMCMTAPAPSGTAVSAQTAGDCQTVVCDGAGSTMMILDDTDVPSDDGNECTNEECDTTGMPAHVPVAAATPCAGGLCSPTGTCVSCVDAGDCPGTDDECRMRSCSPAGVCGEMLVPAGTPVAMQTAGDCHERRCDGAGAVDNAVDASDLPDDSNECTSDLCTAGTPTHPPVASGVPCGAGSSMCDGAGMCVGCSSPSDCGTATDCATPTCSAGGVCGNSFAPADTRTSMQTSGDCSVNECDGAGMVRTDDDDTDVDDDGNECTTDTCSSGTSVHAPAAMGTPCSLGICNDMGMCVTPPMERFWVLRIGDGVLPLSTAAAPVFLERRAADGTLVGIVTMPVAMVGMNRPFVMSGDSSSEGNLSRSADGRYVTLGGYATLPGTPDLDGTTAAAVNRLVARVDAAGSIDTTSLISDGFNTNNIRSVTSVDGTAFWASGTGSGGSGGVRYLTLGNPGPTVQVLMTPNNVRWTNVVGTQLYASSGSGGFTQVFAVGTGTPTTAGAAAVLTPGMPTMGAFPYGFAFFDRNGAVAGNDTLYVADDTAGVQKWTFDGTTWTLAATFNTMLATGARGLTGYVDGANVVLVVTSDDNAATRLLSIVDDGTATPPTTLLATAPTNTVFKGVALAPL